MNTLHFSFNDKEKWVSDLLLEFIYTKWQSGTRHDRPATPEELKKNPGKTRYVIGGCDDYFNNGEYKSGWTYNGKVVGLPLFTPMPVGENGITPGVCNNRIVAWNFGVGGMVCRKIPYIIKVTYSRNHGTYGQRLKFFNDVPRQVSGALELTFRDLLPYMSAMAGVYADAGSLFPDSVGVTLKFLFKGDFGRRRAL